MSGHSHFSTIKHKKAAEDAKRSKTFSKLTQLIIVATKEKGGVAETNPKLKLAIEQAKAANMPSENIERAIKKGTGELAAEKLEEVAFEAYGPGGIAIIIEGITDNKNRTLGEIKQILNQANGKLVTEGSVRWMFERKGIITMSLEENQIAWPNREDLELALIEAGAEDVYFKEDYIDLHTKAEDLEKVKKALEEKSIKIESASLGWTAKEEIAVDQETKENCLKLFETLDDNDSIQGVYSNLRV
ncbi:MAG: YebC/PmpR family DNA-binding transcriptional regulator [Candidatus Pacebacteria bacterium]|nr:YebC/PmpR family DNA-binding transcriptional regulator [Candidatus Paceibacterota bacterium]